MEEGRRNKVLHLASRTARLWIVIAKLCLGWIRITAASQWKHIAVVAKPNGVSGEYNWRGEVRGKYSGYNLNICSPHLKRTTSAKASLEGV